MNERAASPPGARIDATRWQALSPLLDEVLDLAPAARDPWLAALAARDRSLHDDIVALLERRARASRAGFLRDAVAGRPSWIATPGLRIGAYTLVEPLGRGGMGTVWLARRSDGRFDGTVAIKLLDVALAGVEGEARFVREGTILARLRHPHVAQLLDAGLTATGQPYLVIEHVEGMHVDAYCREHRLGLDDRLALYLDVLSAVSHAHANLIVHRDLKPSNVLVRTDGTIKLLDFGIAALVGPDMAATRLTLDGAHPLTPAYATPEQVLGAPITTATDVYALGVMLYDLLEAPHPVTARARTPAQVVEAIVAQPAPPLSAGSPFGGALGGDLDVIAARALEKDPARRYPSVQSLADDVRRALRHDPIVARTPTLTYRAHRFVRRHRLLLAGVAAALMVLVGALAFHAQRLEVERDRAQVEAARATRVSALLTTVLTAADPYATPGGEPTLRAVLERGAAQVRRELDGEPDLRADLLTLIGRVQQRLGRHAEAEPLLQEALVLGRRQSPHGSARVATTLNDLGVLHVERGRPADAIPILEEALALRRTWLGTRHADVAITLVELGRALQDVGRLDDAERLYREALAIRTDVFGLRHRETATSQTELGLLLRQRGQLDAAERLLRASLETTRAVLPADHPNVASAWNNLALMLLERGQYAEAEMPLRQALAIKRAQLGARHPALAPSLSNLAATLRELGRLDEAQQAIEAAIVVTRDGLGDRHPSLGGLLATLGRVRLARGDHAAAERALREAWQRQQESVPDSDWRRAATASQLAGVLLTRGARDEARALLAYAAPRLRDVPGRQGVEAAATRRRLAEARASGLRPVSR